MTTVVDCGPSDGWPYTCSRCGRKSCDPPDCSTRFYGDADGVHLVCVRRHDAADRGEIPGLRPLWAGDVFENGDTIDELGRSAYDRLDGLVEW